MLGLSACGGQTSSSSESTDSSSSTETSSTETSNTEASSSEGSSSSSSSSSSSTPTSAEDILISWQGALVDGTLVDYISSEDGKNGSLVLSQANAKEPLRWLGAMTTTDDGTVTITDDQSKETVSFQLDSVTREGAVTIDVEGYGKGALVPMSAADWQRVAEAEETAATLGTTVNWVGAFEDGSLAVYIDNEAGTQAALAIQPAKSTAMKTWTGAVTATDDGKVTITDDTTGEAITITVTRATEDGSLIIESDEYGKGVLVQMTVADWMALDEVTKSETKSAGIK